MFVYTVEFQYTKRPNDKPLGKHTSVIVAKSDTSAINALYTKCNNSDDEISNVTIINKHVIEDSYILF